jgi:hypothetical protein
MTVNRNPKGCNSLGLLMGPYHGDDPDGLKRGSW